MSKSSPVNRGDVWLVSLGAGRGGEPAKTRPAVVISVEEANLDGVDELVVVVPISSSRAPSALRPELSKSEGVDKESRAICRAVRAVNRSRLLRRTGRVNSKTLKETEQALALVLGL